MFCAEAGSFSGPDFSQTRSEFYKKLRIFKINFFNISLAKVTIHN